MVNCTVCNVYIRVLLFIMMFQLPLPFYTAVRQLNFSDYFDYRQQEVYFTLLQDVANGHLKCN